MTKLKLVREKKEDEKLAPQQETIYNAMLAVGVGKEVDRDEFVKSLEKSGKLTTRQDVGRVVSYYMQDFTKRGLAETVKPPPAPKEEKKTQEPSKPGAKSPAAAGAEKKPEKQAAAAA